MKAFRLLWLWPWSPLTSGKVARMHARVVHTELVARRAGVLLAVLVCLVVSGCRTFSVDGAASSEIVSCRDQWQHGLEALQHQQWAKAELLFAGAVRTCPKDERARQHYADALWHRAAWHEATQQMEEAVQLSGGDPSLLVRLGKMYFSLERYDEANACAAEALARQADLPQAWALRGDIHQQRGDRPTAIADYHRALSLQPDMPAIQLALVRNSYETNDLQQALTTLHALKDGTPPAELSHEVLYLDGLIHKSLRRYEDAARSFRQLARLGQGGSEIFYELANAELLSGHPEAARHAAQIALAWNVHHLPTRSLLARIDSPQDRMATNAVRLPR